MALSTDEWTKVNEMVGSRAEVYKFEGLGNDEWTPSLVASHLSDKTVHVFGTFSTGGSLTWYGSNNFADKDTDPEHTDNEWIPLKDNQDNDLTKTVKGGDFVIENYWFICAKVTAGDGSTDIDIAVCAKGCA